MIPVDTSSALALAAALLLALPLFASRRRRGSNGRGSRRTPPETTNARFTPQAVRVLTVAERQAHTLLRQAMPGYLVLAQVPVSRFLRVDSGHTQWVQQVSGMSADLVLCDSGSRVLLVVDLRSAQPTENSVKRHERMAKLLKSAGIRVVTWPDYALPDVAAIRAQLVPMLVAKSSAKAPQAAPTTSRPMPLIPVAEILAEGDAEAADAAMEPVPSALFDEFEPDLPEPAKR